MKPYRFSLKKISIAKTTIQVKTETSPPFEGQQIHQIGTRPAPQEGLQAQTPATFSAPSLQTKKYFFSFGPRDEEKVRDQESDHYKISTVVQ